jgi:hypothetical protein
MAQERLNILIGAKDTATGVFRKFQRTLGGVAKGILNFKTALVGTAGIAGIGLLVKNSLEATDRISKLSRTIGLSVQELQGLKFAGEIAGVELETLGKGVRNLSRVTNDFAVRGLTTSKEAFDKLGISIKDIRDLSGDQLGLFELVGDRLGRLENGFEKTAIAQQLFGGRASEVIRVLESGKGSFADLRKEASSLGLVLSTDAARGVESANDAFLRLRRLFTGIVTQMTAALAPALQTLADTLQNKVKNAVDASGGSVAEFGRMIATQFLEGIQRTIIGLQILTNETSLAISTLTRGAIDLGTLDLSGAVGKIEELQQQVQKGTADVVKATAEGGAAATAELEEIKSVTDRLKEAFRENFGFLEQTVESSLQQNITSVFEGTKNTMSAFKDFTRTIINAIIQEFIRLKIVQPIVSGLFGGGVSAAAPVKPPTGAAIGGSVQRGVPRMVGERGKELFVPASSGAIVPNKDLAGNGVTVVNNLTVNSENAAAVRSEIINMLPMIKEASKSAVLEASRRGGSYANSFGN